ncbi:MAG: hypothetical protein HY335_03285, partial [Deinococcus sp.]|nr:hypothetical protein [Deinococcus sp.]
DRLKAVVAERLKAISSSGSRTRVVESGAARDPRGGAITCYLCWTTVGGTGNGTLAEVAHLVREVAQELSLRVVLIGIGILPGVHASIDEGRRARANTYTILKELEAYQCGALVTRAPYRHGGLARRYEKLLDAVYLVGSRNSADVPESIDLLSRLLGMVSKFLHLLTCTPAGAVYPARFNDAEEALGVRDRFGKPLAASSFGLAVIHLPNAELMAYGAARLARRVCASLLAAQGKGVALADDFVASAGLHAGPGGVLDRLATRGTAGRVPLRVAIEERFSRSRLPKGTGRRAQYLDQAATAGQRLIAQSLAASRDRLEQETAQLLRQRVKAISSDAKYGPAAAVGFLEALEQRLNQEMKKIRAELERLSGASREYARRVAVAAAGLERLNLAGGLQQLFSGIARERQLEALYLARREATFHGLRVSSLETGAAALAQSREQVTAELRGAQEVVARLEVLERLLGVREEELSGLDYDFRAPHGLCLVKRRDRAALEEFYSCMVGDEPRAVRSVATWMLAAPESSSGDESLELLVATCRRQLRELDVLEEFQRRYSDAVRERYLELAIAGSREFFDVDRNKDKELTGLLGESKMIKLIGVAGGDSRAEQLRQLFAPVGGLDRDWLFVDTGNISELVVAQARIGVPCHAHKELPAYWEEYRRISSRPANVVEEVLHTDPGFRLLPEVMPIPGPDDPALARAVTLALAIGALVKENGTYQYLTYGDQNAGLSRDALAVNGPPRQFFFGNQDLLVDLAAQHIRYLRTQSPAALLGALAELRRRQGPETELLDAVALDALEVETKRLAASPNWAAGASTTRRVAAMG